MVTEKLSYPTIPAAHFFAIRNQFNRTIPTSIDSNYLSTVLSIDKLAASANILPGLKIIKLIDNDGKVNFELAKKFRDENEYPNFCKQILKDCYPEALLEIFSEVPEDKTKVKTWFKNNSGVGENAAGKYASFFVLMLEANPNKAQDGKVKSSNGVKTKEKKVKLSPKGIQKNDLEVTQEKGEAINKAKSNSPEIHINVQVHISAEATNEQIEKIFESMGKHLFKNV